MKIIVGRKPLIVVIIIMISYYETSKSGLLQFFPPTSNCRWVKQKRGSPALPAPPWVWVPPWRVTWLQMWERRVRIPWKRQQGAHYQSLNSVLGNIYLQVWLHLQDCPDRRCSKWVGHKSDHYCLMFVFRRRGRHRWCGGMWTTPSTTRPWPPSESTSPSRPLWWMEARSSYRSGKWLSSNEKT